MAREQRLVFGEVAELYERARPSYPGELADTVASLAGGQGFVVDAGCGTGKAAVLLAERGLDGVGVEPSEEMATVARQRLAPFAGWRVEVCGFEDFAGADGPADLVTAAQSWHWMDPDRGPQQAHHLLRPGGWLALWWNRPSSGDTGRARPEIDAVYERVVPALGYRVPGRKGRPPEGDYPDGVRFGTPIERSFPWTATYTSAQYCDLLRTQSDHRLLPPDTLDALLDGIRAVVDGMGGTIDVAYTCDLWAAERLNSRSEVEP